MKLVDMTALKYFYSKLEQIFTGVTVTIKPQQFTDEQKAQARANIGAGSADFTGDYNDLINKPQVAGQSSIDAGKTIKSWSETDGKVAITTQDIEIVKEQISDFAHTHTVEDITDLDGMNFATEQYVADAIAELPSPMVFKGSLGTDGTITTLPNAVKANTGFTYKVITDSTYSGQKAKSGDMFISDGSKWIYIPSADEEGGVTSVNVSVPTGLSVSGVPITTSGTIAITNEEGYSIPAEARQEQWDAAFEHSESTHARADATKVEASETNGNIKINDVETTVYEHPTQTAKTSGMYKIAVDSTGHVSNAITASASDLAFDGTVSDVEATNVQDAIDNILEDIAGGDLVHTDRKIADITLENDIEAIDLSEKILPTFETREELEAFEAEHGAFPVGTKIVITSEQGEGGGASSADKVSYDNTESGLTATNVQSAIDEIKDEFHAEITHVNTSIAGCVKTPDDETAIIGQSLYVAEVDEDGKPTKWTYSIPDPLAPIMDKDISELTYDEIATIVRAGRAEGKFHIGDQIVTTYTATNGVQYEMPWDVVAFRESELEDGSIVPGMIIQSHYATVESMQFDAQETSSPNSNVKSYGWNRWMYSSIRQWLNSSADKDSWWASAHSTDAAPNNLSTVNGFMKGFSSDFINMLKKTKHETALNYSYPAGTANTYVYDTTYDTFFLPSVKEEHFKYSQYPTYWDGSDREGSTWEYWIQRKGSTPIEYDVKNPSSIRYSLAEHSNAKLIWLRSANRASPHSESCVSSTGYYGSNASNANFCCAPACVIC